MTPSALNTRSMLQHVTDRRRAPRARLGVSVTLTLGGLGSVGTGRTVGTVGGKLVDALGADLSPGGIRVLADVDAGSARVGDEVSLVFLLDGDIVGIDCGVVYKGYYGDAARTYAVGEVSPVALRLMAVT